MVDYVRHWTQRAELPAKKLLTWLELATSKYHAWQEHYGKPHAHNGRIPRDGWLEAWEKQAILDYHTRFPLEGCRRREHDGGLLEIRGRPRYNQKT